jgi:hypothetical protein
MFRHFVKALTLVSIFCCFSTLAIAQANINENLETATLYVDVINGNDSNPGTQQLPLQDHRKIRAGGRAEQPE